MKTHKTVILLDSSAIGMLRSFSAGGGDVNYIDTTTWDDATYRTFIGGLVDSGTFSCGGIAKPEEAGQAKMISEVGTVKAVSVTPPGAGATTFNIVVGPYELDGTDEDGNVMFAFSGKITGQVTWGSSTV